jgi:[protein-PII] uridylyltransferase
VVAHAAREFLSDQLAVPFSLLAVGGYGRRELFPSSDIDLILLLDEEPDPGVLKEPLSQFLRALWDAGLKASHSVRTIDECCRLNERSLHLSISLLDVRFLDGGSEPFRRLNERLPDFFRRHSRVLLRGLAELTRERQAKFGNTVYHLEPNIKEGPGGIRDIHLLDWAARLVPDSELVRHAVDQVTTAREFLYQVRFFLHERSGRDNNVLSFELQDEAARALPPEPLPPAGWMRVLYRHTRVVFQAARQVLDFASRSDSGLVRQFLDRRDRLSTADFTVSHNQVFLRNPAATLASLDSIFDLFIFVARRGIPLSWDAQRRLAERAAELAAAPIKPAPWKRWYALLAHSHASLALREMQDCSLLAVAFPQWKAVESLVVRDFYHRYTVDEHTLLAIGSIDSLLVRGPSTLPRFHQLAEEEENLPLLRMALLLHDVGKGTSPGDHVRGSLEEAALFLAGIGMPEAERRGVEFLIAHHLDLSLVMTGRDLDDPVTARQLSAQIPTYEDLRRLTLLTFADVSAVNPSAMSPWRAEQLWRVYSITRRQLTRELASARIHRAPDATLADFTRPDLARFLEGFPTRYSRIHSKEQMQEHYRLEQTRLRDGVALQIRNEPGAYALTVLAADHPGLFAALCGTLASFGMNIVKAEAASNANGCALDEIRFTDPHRTLELNPDEVERLRWTIECVVKGAVEVSDLLKRRRVALRPHSLPNTSTVRFDDTASDSATLLTYTGNDRPGLLFDLASVLTNAGCNIEVVLVNTEGHRASDVFYLTRAGTKLNQATQRDLLPQLTAK